MSQVQPTEQPQKNQFTQQLEQKYASALQNIGKIYNDIETSFQVLGDLKQDSFMIKEKKFIKSFLSIMNKMSNELQTSIEAYNNIDQEINSDPQCVYLEKQLLFFQNQCLNTQKQLELKQEALKGEKEKYHLIQKEHSRLQNELKYQTKKDIKYRSKTKSLFERSTELQSPCMTQRESPRQRSTSYRNYSFQFDLQSKPSGQSIKLKPKIPHSISQFRSTHDFARKFL